jgi:hypothetical protein
MQLSETTEPEPPGSPIATEPLWSDLETGVRNRFSPRRNVNMFLEKKGAIFY